jgi:hypothetical protein
MMAASSKRAPPSLPMMVVSSKKRMASPGTPSSAEFGIESLSAKPQTAVPKIAKCRNCLNLLTVVN